MKHNTFAYYLFFLFCSLLSFLIGCSTNESPKEYIAKVGDEVLTKRDIPTLIDTNINSRNVQLQAYINSWIDDMMLYQEAKKNGFDKAEDIEQRIDDVRKKLSVQKLIDENVYLTDDTVISEHQLQTYFEEHPNEFIANDVELLMSSVTYSQRNYANTFRALLLRGASWKQAIEQIKKNPDAIVRLSEKIFLTKQSLSSPELWNVASSMNVNDISFPVRTSEGYTIFVVHDIERKGEKQHFLFARDEVRERIFIQKRNTRYTTFLKDLREKYVPEIHLEDSIH